MKTLVSTTLAVLALTVVSVSAARAADGWARSSGVLRAGPGTSYPPVGRIAAGEDMRIHGCLRRWSWCDVSVDGDRGWFPGRRIALESRGRRVELPAAAAIVGLGVLGFERDLYWREHYRDRSFPARRGRGEERSFVPPPPPPMTAAPRTRPHGFGDARPPAVRQPFVPPAPAAPAPHLARPPHPGAPSQAMPPTAPGGCTDSACR